MDIAVPLGMTVNELITNSFKHAFPNKKEGEIQIRLYREEEGECIKCINSDNGMGIPEGFDVEDVETLGMQLVTTLVDQLDGELELKRNNGTEFNIRFTVRENNDQALSPAQLQSVDDE